MRLRAVRIEPGEGFRWKGYKGPAIRRPLSLTKPRRTLERAIRRDAEAMARRVAALLREEGVLGRLDEDARQRAEKRAKGPTGRGGRPLGPQRTLELERVFDYEELQTVARLFSDEERAFALELETTLEDAYEDLFELGGQAARRALGVRGSFNLRAPGIADALAERANQLAGNVSDDVFERLKTVLADQFYLKGKHPFEVAAVLEEEFDWMSRSRAELIARTESGAVTEEAQFITYEASGVPFKRWLTTLDGREREDHFDAHGQIRAIDEPFDVGGEELMYPLDPAGSAKQVCNCRCTQIPVIGREQFLDESTVWDGENDPDEFAKEKRAKRTRVLLRQATKHLPGEHDQETHGRGGGASASRTDEEDAAIDRELETNRARQRERTRRAVEARKAAKELDNLPQTPGQEVLINEMQEHAAAGQLNHAYQKLSEIDQASGADPAMRAALDKFAKPMNDQFAVDSTAFLPAERETFGEFRSAANEAQVARARELEAQIAGGQREHGYLIGPDGAVIADSGTEERGSYSWCQPLDPAAPFPRYPTNGAVLVHNHPNSTPLSRQDVAYAGQLQLAEIRAVGYNGNRFRAAPRAAGGWAVVGREHDRRQEKLIDRYAQAIRSGEMVHTEAAFRMSHEIWTSIAKDGLADYEYEPPARG